MPVARSGSRNSADATSQVRPAFGILVCENCDHCDWTFTGGRSVSCQFCGASFPFRGGILDYCAAFSSRSNPAIEEWNSHYGAEVPSYSTRKDWWTVSAWKKHLFAPVLPDLAGKLVLDAGCGTADRIVNLAPIQEYGYRYIGIDSSFDALQRAVNNMPGGFFIHANLNSLRLQPGTVDVILCLGLLMYFEGQNHLLDRLLSTLKPGGLLLLHELVSRKGWGRFARALLPLPAGIFPNRNIYPVSERQIRDQLTRHGTILHLHRAGSPGRALLARLLDCSPFESVRTAAAWCDSKWCATLGRMWPAMGAAELQIVFRKA